MTHVRAGAVGAMGRSLGQIADAAERARALIAAGNAVITVEADKIDASFIADRLETDTAEHRGLVESIRVSGQQVPVLLRPHPIAAGRYQTAYGHRRVRVLKELGRPVKAIVKALSDEELVVAQGQENSARTDLSYIERARFALALENGGFSRAIVMAALNVEKTQLSRLIAVARSIPADLSSAIGPAPKAGRPRWMALAERLAKAKPRQRDALSALLGDADFRSVDSDTRFVQVFAQLAPRAAEEGRTKSLAWRDSAGRKVASIERGPGRVAITVEDKDMPEFGEFLADHLPSIYADFVNARKKQKTEAA